MTTPIYDQDSYEGRDDDVVLNSATFNGGGGLNTTWTQATDTNFRIRYLVQETAGGMGTNVLFDLWFTHTQGAGVPEVMTATSALQPAATSQYADGDTTTQVLGGGTYVTGESRAGVDDGVITGNVDFAGSDEAEIEWTVTIDSAQVADADTFTAVEVRNSGTRLGSRTNAVTITVSKPAAEIPNRFFSTNQAVNRAATY